MTESVIIDQIDLRGFRGFLKPQSILIRKRHQNSLAIFAPNGTGKSSLVDALEYYFKEGKATIGRLGVNATDRHAGRKYVNHVSADKNDMMVHIRFKHGNDVFEDSRTGDLMPNGAKRIRPLIKVPFIIRDYELREFVQKNQYHKLIEWFNLKPLGTIQENLQTLKNKINSLKKDKSGEDVLLDQLRTLTGHEFPIWYESDVLKWLNDDVLVKLGAPTKFNELTRDDPAFQELVRHSEMEQNSVTTGHLNNLLGVIQDLFILHASPQAEPAGLIVAFERTVSDFESAVASANDAKSKTSDHVFKAVWAKSQELLLAKPDRDRCPVCETLFVSSSLGSRDAVLNNLHVNLDRLIEYKKAEENKTAVEVALSKAVDDLKSKLSEFFRWVGAGYQYVAVTDYSKTLQSWKMGDNAPDNTDAVNTLTDLYLDVTNDIKTQSNERAYSDALSTTKQLLEIVAGWNRLSRIRSNLALINGSLDRQAGIIDRTIVEHIDGMVDKLKDVAQTINQEIQGPYEPKHPIEIRLAEEVKRNQRTAHVFTNFMNRGEDVPPDGILSESQNRTLALAIRLAAIIMFNTEFKVIVLDDVAMSYDAERRQHIAALLHERFSEFQIILVTHDSFFYGELRDRLSHQKWRFMEFDQFTYDYGPIIKDTKTLEMLINEKIANNEPLSGNDMRIAYEEWLNHICAGFATLLPHKPRKRPDLHCLIESLGRFLKENNLQPPPVSGYSGSYLEVMKKAKFLNITSHYNEHLGIRITPNELKTAWKEFSEFKNHFKCSGCDGDRFIKEQGKPPKCVDCRAEFAFVQGVSRP